MLKLMKAATIACVATSALAGSAYAVPAANPVADNVVCFISALPPFKTGEAAIAPINFGFKVHCTGRPALRNVTTKLWRYDTADGHNYVHVERNDNSTDPDVELLYTASCSSAGIFYRFHTEAIANAFNGNWDRESDNSSAIGAVC